MILHALAVGGLYAAGIYLLVSRGWKGMVLGLALLSHATNLLLFVTAGLHRGSVPLVAAGRTAPDGPVPDPLVQALILTAVVITFGMLALALVMVRRASESAASEPSESQSPEELKKE